jgi:hypothetical protein
VLRREPAGEAEEGREELAEACEGLALLREAPIEASAAGFGVPGRASTAAMVEAASMVVWCKGNGELARLKATEARGRRQATYRSDQGHQRAPMPPASCWSCAPVREKAQMSHWRVGPSV